MRRQGALPYQEMEQLIDAGFLKGFRTEQLQPASADLSVGEEAYRVWGSVLPLPGVRVREFLHAAVLFPHDLSNPIEPGGTYLIRVAETVQFPPEAVFYCSSNAKSSSGRNDLHVRLVADGVTRFDTVPRGFAGELWFLISSGHFLVQISPGDTLAQLRVFDRDTRFDETELQLVYPHHQFLWNATGEPIAYEDLKISDHDGSLILTIDLSGAEVIGYRAKPRGQAPVLMFNRRDHRIGDFFEPIERPPKKRLMLEEGGFYVFFTKEGVRVPPMFAAEMGAVDERSGEFRSHYAGFIDPGWGHGRTGEHCGWPLVLEMRPFGRNVILVDGGPVCKLRYEHVRAEPTFVYGETGSHYVRQHGAMLSKHFR